MMGDLWISALGDCVEWCRDMRVGDALTVGSLRINGKTGIAGDAIDPCFSDMAKFVSGFGGDQGIKTAAVRNGHIINDVTMNEIMAIAYAAVMGVDWSKVKSWREVDGSIEFEME